MSDSESIRRIIKSSNAHGVDARSIDEIALEMAPQETPVEACHFQDLWIGENKLPGQFVALITSSRLLVAQFVRGAFRATTTFHSFDLGNIREVSNVEKLKFSIAMADGTVLVFRGIGTFSKKYTASFQETLTRETDDSQH